MARQNSTWRLAGATLGILFATAWTAQVALAQSYTFVQDSDNTSDWVDTARWSGGPVGTFPNGADVSVEIDTPMSTAGGTYRIEMPAPPSGGGTDVTLGDLTIDNTSSGNDRRHILDGNGGKLIFQSNSGPATFTETRGLITDPVIQSVQLTFNPVVELLSDIIINQDNYPNLNTGTQFANLVTGGSGITITKEGYGGIQFQYNHLPGETLFQGDVVINQGGIRQIALGPLSAISGMTVNSGGQYHLADNGQNPTNSNWNFGPGAVLKLNGAGKALLGPGQVSNADGALRFAVAQITTTSFDNPVELESDSVISVGVAALSATLSEAVSGDGGLTKHGLGTLIIGSATDATNAYNGDTTLLAGGPLSISNPFLEDVADVYLTTGSFFNLNFGGADTIRSLYIDGVPQPIGTYSSSTPATAALITGSGSLNVMSVPVTDDADFDGDGDVDGNDFLIWQRGVGTAGGQPQGNADGMGNIDGADLDIWKTQFGPGGPATPTVASIPEPATAFLAIAAAVGIAAIRRRPRAA